MIQTFMAQGELLVVFTSFHSDKANNNFHSDNASILILFCSPESVAYTPKLDEATQSLFLIKDKNIKVYNDLYGRLCIYHTTKTAKIKKKVILLCNTSPECQCSAVL